MSDDELIAVLTEFLNWCPPDMEHGIKEAIARLSCPAPAVQVPEGYRLVPTKEKLPELLVVGARIRIGEQYAEKTGDTAGRIITLVEGEFDGDNGLFATTHYAPSEWNDAMGEFDSIYHLFENDLSGFMDCEVLAPTPAPVATEAVAQDDHSEHPLDMVAQGGGVDVEKVMALVRDYGHKCAEYGCYGPDLENIRALLASPAGTVGDGWMPIETAPKDNAERILLCKDCGPGSLQSYSVGFFINGWHGAECRGMQTLADIGYRVTHWMPLPDYPPAPAATKKEKE